MIDRKHDLSTAAPGGTAGHQRVARRTALPRPVSDADLALMRRIDAVAPGTSVHGCARARATQLERAGLARQQAPCRQLMGRMGIEALAPQPDTSKRVPRHKIYPYLLLKLAIMRASHV